MRGRHTLVHLVLAAWLGACTGNETLVAAAKEAPRVIRQTIPHPDAPQKQIEFYHARPGGAGPSPAIVYIHGHQPGDRPGGKDAADRGILAAMARRGVVAVSVSQPGYGDSDGPPDYCGPYTQRAVLAVLAELRRWPFVDPGRIALYGVSRGAVVASLVEAQDQRLAAAVLVVGFYDFEKSYQRLVEEGRTNSEAGHIVANMDAEAGTTAAAMRARSAIVSANRIRTPTLIINGARDFRVAVADVLEFERALQKNGVPARAVIYPDHGHFIPIAERNQEIDPFLEKYLGVAPEAR